MDQKVGFDTVHYQNKKVEQNTLNTASIHPLDLVVFEQIEIHI